MVLDLTGQNFGRLTVKHELPPILPTKPGGGKIRVFHCSCQCGGTLPVRMSNLRSGHTLSCGCKLKEKVKPRAIDRTGQKIGCLTIGSVARTKGVDTTWWQCSCDCGGHAELRISEIRQNKDCGCGLSSEDHSGEEWLPIRGLEGRYMISSHGRVRSLVTKDESIMSPYKNKKGYLGVVLRDDNGEKVRRLVHRLVAEAFIPNPLGKGQVNHDDGVKSNNRVGNLEWATNQENRDHAIKTGLHKNPEPRHGPANSSAKLSEDQVLEIRRLAETMETKHVASRFAVDPSTIDKILKRETWTHV